MDQKQFEALLSDAETRLRRLKLLYEQWFAGFERMEPTVARKEVDDLLQRLRREQIRNTGLRFRLQQLVQRHTTFTTYWRRIARQIEEGTYQRDVLKAKKLRDQMAREGNDPEISYGSDVDVAIDADMDAALEDVLRDAEAAVERSTSTEQAAKAGAAPTATPALNPAPAPLPVAPSAAAKSAPETKSGPAMPPVPAAVSGAKKPPSPPPRPPVGPRSISPFAHPLPPVPAASAQGRPAGATMSLAPGKPKAPPPPPTAPVAQAGASKPATANPGSAAQPAAPAGGSLSSSDLQRIYDSYVAARKQNSERVDNVKIESIEKSLRGMLPTFEKKHAGKKIDFEVVVKDGKVALKPVAK
ncbi:MAG TPA: MXAN_5187 C-terminal domain-containing protein [Polyangiales bacterium]